MKIAYITEKNSTNILNGSILRDERLIQCLECYFEVDVFYNSAAHCSRWEIFKSRKDVSENVRSALTSNQYDFFIISTFAVSPCYLSYSKINPKVIYYLCDSMFHIKEQYLDIRTKILSIILAQKERKMLKNSFAAYLGNDEVKYLPDILRRNALVFPFGIDSNKNLFDKNGFVTFVGDYSFLPNKSALLGIIEIARNTEIKFKVFGENLPSNIHLPDNIEYKGYVDNLSDIYKGARALIYPIKYGTGIKNKVIEAMSYGIPVIGFKEAFTNIELLDGMDNCIVSDLQEFIVSIEGDLSLTSCKVTELVKLKFSINKNAEIILQQLSSMD